MDHALDTCLESFFEDCLGARHVDLMMGLPGNVVAGDRSAVVSDTYTAHRILDRRGITKIPAHNFCLLQQVSRHPTLVAH